MLARCTWYLMSPILLQILDVMLLCRDQWPDDGTSMIGAGAMHEVLKCQVNAVTAEYTW